MTDHHAANSLFLTRQIPLALSSHIESIWLWRGQPRANGLDRILPDGAASLIINLHEDETRIYSSADNSLTLRLDGCGFDGAQIRPFVIDTREQIYVAGVTFCVGGAWPFIKAAQDELLNAHLSARDIWGSDADNLREQLLLAPSPADALAHLEKMLLGKLHKPLQRHAAVRYALSEIQKNPGSIRMADCLQPGGVGTRRLTRLFEIETGMTPKRLARLMRFRQVIAYLHQAATSPQAAVDWSDIALRFGYYDQAHFAHEFKNFSGFTPSAYLPLIGEFENHIALD